jgi:hypothetical protein
MVIKRQKTLLKLMHSLPISFQSSSMDRLAALRGSALSLEKNFSIGYKPGEWVADRAPMRRLQ